MIKSCCIHIRSPEMIKCDLNHVNAEINMEYINHFFKNCDYKLIIKYAKQSFTV